MRTEPHKLLVHSEHRGPLGFVTRLFLEDGTELPCVRAISAVDQGGGLMQATIDFVNVQLVTVEKLPAKATP